MDKLTSSRRMNMLEKCFDALIRAREMKVQGVALINRWMVASRMGEIMWAFHSWKSKAHAASAYMSRAAFLNAADSETRAHLAFILNRFWKKKDCGSFGVDSRADKRLGYMRWKHAVQKEIDMERAWDEVELKTRACGNVLGLIGELGAEDREGFSYNDKMYLYVRHYVWEMCNGGKMGGFFEFGNKDEEKKRDEDDENEGEQDDDIEGRVVRGCLVMAQPDTNKYLVYSQGRLVVIPGGEVLQVSKR